MTSTEKGSSNNKTIHVLHIASGDLWAGAEVMLYTLAKSLHSDLCTQVTVALLNPGKLEQELRSVGINVYIIDESHLNSVQILCQLSDIIGAIKPDVIHTHRTKENILGSIAAWYKYRIPSLRTVHGTNEHRPLLLQVAKHIVLYLNRFSGRYLQQYIVAVSADLASKLKNDFPEPKIKTIENGVDINTLLHSVIPPSSKDDNIHHVGIVGRLTSVKRVDIFINCAVRLKKHHPELNIQFHIFGSGPLQETLTDQVKSNRADDYIHFEGHSENIPQHLQTLDILLMTSDHEGLPMILLEAMCMKTPIVAHAVGGIPHLLDQGHCGVLVRSQTSKAFSEAVVKQITQPEQYQHLAQLAFERINQNYSAKFVAGAYLKAYKKLTARKATINN